MGTLTTRVVTRLSSIPSGFASYTNSGTQYDYAIGGLPFLSGASDRRPITRQTGPYRKDQFDTSADPGEQSLVSWWLRAQSSFHAGTGIVYEEPSSQAPNDEYRFQDSLGIDPWTLGKAKLLPATTLNKSAANPVLIHGCVDSAGPTDIYLQAETTGLSRCVSGSSTAITWGGTGTILSLADDGANYYAADATGIYQGTLAGGAGTKIWNTGSGNVCIKWAKQRLVAGIGPSLYELNGSGPALPTAKYTHPNPAWKWTSITETPSAILAAGYAGAQSTIFKLTLDTTGIVPMTVATQSAQLPAGEIVYSIYDYLGDYVVIGTNKGVRVATVDDNGNLQWGPLTITSTQPVLSLTGRDRFVFASCTNQLAGNSGLWCIDLGTTTRFRTFAYATHLQAHVAGTARATQLGSSGRLVISVDGQGSYLESTTTLESTGYLQTGRIRYHTLEPKLFKYVRPRVEPLAGSLSVSVINPQGTETTLASWAGVGLTSLDETQFPTNLGAQEYVSLRFTLNRDTGAGSTGPTLTGYQVKALPAAKRQRMYVLPLLCFDYEKDKYGNTSGGEGTAVARLEALEALEEAADVLNLQDLGRDPTDSRLGVIDDIKFIQDRPPSNASGWGGYIFLTFRAVT